jgi:hypothetical protein
MLSCILPTLPFIHAGIELGETLPVNTGLLFSTEEALRFPDDKLPLFSAKGLNWFSKLEWTDEIRKIIDIRKKYLYQRLMFSKESLRLLKHDNDGVIIFTRLTKLEGKALLVVSSFNDQDRVVRIYFDDNYYLCEDLMKGSKFTIEEGLLRFRLKPWQIMVGELSFKPKY